MSLSEYFSKECEKRVQENITLALKKISDPFAKINFELSSPLIKKALDSQGSFGDFVSKQIKDNGDLLTTSAVGLASDVDQQNIRDAYAAASNVIGTAIVAKNDLLLIFMKKVAKNAVLEIAKKEAHLLKIKKTIEELRGYLLTLTKSNADYEKYLAQLRSALVLLAAANQDLRLVRGSFSSRQIWLSQRFAAAKKNISLAKTLMLPDVSNEAAKKKSANDWVAAKQAVSSYYDSTTVKKAGIQQMTNWGLPANHEQMIAFKKIPLLARRFLSETQDYTVTTLVLNGLLAAYKEGLADIKKALPSFLKTYTVGLLDKLIKRSTSLEGEMSGTLYNDAKDPLLPTKVVIYSAKWHAELSLLAANFDIFPEDGLKAITLNRQAVGVYEETVAYLKSLGTVSVQGAQLVAVAAEENPINFDTQIAVFGMTAIESLTSTSKRAPAASLGVSLMSRIDLAISRDKQIAATLTRFINTPIPLESSLEVIGGQMTSLLKNMGFDKAAESLSSGKFSKFFKLNARDATTVGAGLTAISLLKKCLPTVADQEKLSELQTELERSEDLIHFKLKIDFDFAIFKNLNDCIKFTNLATFAKIKEAICGLLFDSVAGTPTAVGKILGKLPI